MAEAGVANLIDFCGWLGNSVAARSRQVSGSFRVSPLVLLKSVDDLIGSLDTHSW